MSKTLVIVDSISKYNILFKFLGNNYFIYSGIDIIKDPAGTKFIFDEKNDLIPHFSIYSGSKEKIKQLIETAVDFENIIIAADPGLRGEILVKCFEHIFIKNKSKVKRVLIYEYTGPGIKRAFERPVSVNNLLINASYTRLAINRLIHDHNKILHKFSLNDILLENIMALKLICEREDQIDMFRTEKVNNLKVELKVNDNQSIICPLVRISGNAPVIPDSYHAKAIIKDMKKQLFQVKNITRQKKKNPPPVPFTTITLLHEAYKKYTYSVSETLKNSRELYEGIDLGRAGLKGLITFYHTRGNYTNPELVLKTRELIYMDYGADYLPSKPYSYSKDNALFEAIRPVDVKLFPKKVRKYLTESQFNIYSLIWNRFIASQMSPSIEEQITVDILSDTENRYELKTEETKDLFRGYKLLDSDSKQNNYTHLNTISKEMRKNQTLHFKAVEIENKVETPVTRYTETGLLEELVPAARDYFPDLLQMTGTLFANKLIKYHKDQILPTPTGYRLCHFVLKHFPNIYNPGFITKISNELECIEMGNKQFITVLENFKKLQQHVILNKSTEPSPETRDKNSSGSGQCPVCNSLLELIDEQGGQFLVCENFPENCQYAEPVPAANKNSKFNEKCVDCGSPMVVREGQYGRFLACSKYPKCTRTKAYPIGVRCPREGCGGEIVEKKTRSGKPFYGCDRYPKCKFASWQKPENILCEHCGNLYLVLKTDGFEKFYLCPKCHKKYDMNAYAVENN